MSECIHCGASDDGVAVRVARNDHGEHYTVCEICEPTE